MADITKALNVVRKLSPSGFFSRAAEAAQEIPQAKGTPEQMRKMLLDRKGVKPEELRWTGFDEWAKGKKSVTRDEITEFLRRNEVQVGEKTLSGDVKTIQSRIDGLENTRQNRNWTDAEEAEYRRLVNILNDDNAPIPKFSEYTLPGGENYRELLLTRPEVNPDATPRFSMREGSGMRRVDPDNYRSSHWNEPNVLAHMRMKERVDPEGRRVLHLEELQSDWAQQGRLVGFYTDEASAAANRERNAARQTQIQDEVRRILNGRKSTELSPEELRPIQKLVDENLLLNKHPQGVPSAPFVESTPGWTNFALRRAMIEAARRNYDAIAWTPGREQAARYPGGGAAREAGMSGYYDKILPTQISKVLKDIGETPQFGNVSIPVERQSSKQFIPSGPDLQNAPQSYELPSFNITPEMREKINQGLPLFTMMPAAIGLGAAQMQERAPVEGSNPAVEPQTTEPERREFQGGGRTEMDDYTLFSRYRFLPYGQSYAPDSGGRFKRDEMRIREMERAQKLAQELTQGLAFRGSPIEPAPVTSAKFSNRVPPQRVPPQRIPPLSAPIAVGPGRIGEDPAPSEPAAPATPAVSAAPAAARQESPVERAMAVVRNVPRAAYEMVASPVATAQNVAKEIFSGDNYQSTGEPVTSNGRVNWGDPDSAADFFRADAALQELRPYREEGFADGGHVEHALRLIQDEYPTQYLPNVGRQVMADGGAPQDDDIRQYEASMRAIARQPEHIRSMTHAPSKPMRPIEIEGGFIGKRQLGEAPYDVVGPLRAYAQTAYSLKTVPLYFTWAAPFAAAADLGEAVIDTKGALDKGDYLGAGLTGALGVAMPAIAYRKPVSDAVRSGLEAGRRFVAGNPGAATAVGAGAAVMTPQEAEAAKLRAVFAEFDPLKKDSSNIMSSAATAAAALGAASQYEGNADYARGGHVEHALRLIQDEYPTQYLPNVGRQVMADGGSTMEGFMPPTPDETPDDRGERWQAALRNYRNFPVRPGEATLKPADISARDYFAQAIAGEGGPSYGSELRKRAANLLVGSRGLPDTGIGFGVADAPMITGIPLQALDIADATRRGDYGEAALGAALPVAFWARKPLMSAGRRAVEVAGDVLGRVPAPVAAGAAGAAVMTPQEAEASPAKALVRATKKALAPAVEVAGGKSSRPYRSPTQQVDATLDQPSENVLFRGKDPANWTPQDWHDFGKQYGVSNLGPANQKEWKKGLVPYRTISGREITLPPGGYASDEPFTYYDLLHLKSQGINPNDLPPDVHQAIHNRMVRSMQPGPEGPTNEQITNQMIFGLISPNQPLTPNELALQRAMVKGPQDVEAWGRMIPYRYTGEIPPVSERQAISREITPRLGLHAAERGGIGASGSANYTDIAEFVQKMRDKPNFYRFNPNDPSFEGMSDAEKWATHVGRVMNATRGLKAKTGSLASVWQSPETAAISAIDRHMATKFRGDMFPSTDAKAAWEANVVAKYNEARPDAAVRSIDEMLAAPGGRGHFVDSALAYVNNLPAAVTRSARTGEYNPSIPVGLRDLDWPGGEPRKMEMVAGPYVRALEANAEEARRAGQGLFSNQWMLWDRIRNRLEPHEILFPGLEKLPRMSLEQMRRVTKDLSEAGYMAAEGGVRPLPSASRAGYFTIPPILAGGAALLSPEEAAAAEAGLPPERRDGGAVAKHAIMLAKEIGSSPRETKPFNLAARGTPR